MFDQLFLNIISLDYGGTIIRKSRTVTKNRASIHLWEKLFPRLNRFAKLFRCAQKV